jgi:hypothetical protein
MSSTTIPHADTRANWTRMYATALKELGEERTKESAATVPIYQRSGTPHVASRQSRSLDNAAAALSVLWKRNSADPSHPDCDKRRK